jgi:hypothetical protein
MAGAFQLLNFAIYAAANALFFYGRSAAYHVLQTK